MISIAAHRSPGFPIVLMLGFLQCVGTGLDAQKVDPATIKARIEAYKNDVRGPYRDIRWFCKDGTTLPPMSSVTSLAVYNGRG